LAERDEGTVRLLTFVEPLSTARYSGYKVLTPPRIGSNGTHGSSFRNSPIALFCPGRKCGTQWRSVPPFSANDDAVQFSIEGPASGSYDSVIESTYGSSR
jgi:hypothetical protein